MSRIDDGHRTLITFDLSPTVKFYQKEVQPPGIDGGGANDTTTMHNDTWRTMAPKKLYTLSEATLTAAYDPEVFSDILNLINENGEVTVTFPDGATLVFWGWLNSFKPNKAVEGAQPTAEIQIIPSNQDNSGVETAPVYTAP